MVEEVHLFLFILNADSALMATIIFAMSYVALRLIYRMWKHSLRCPHCGEVYKGQMATPAVEQTQPRPLWT